MSAAGADHNASANGEPDAERDAALIAALFAVDPVGTGGVCVRSLASPVRDQWLHSLRDLLPAQTALRRIPFNIADGRLLGGLDLVATLKANRPIAERGVLASAHGGVVVISMAERLTSHTTACLNAVLDAGEVSLPREGISLSHPAHVGIVALDESMSEDECVPAALLDRLAFLLDFNGFSIRAMLPPLHDRQDIEAARDLLPQVQIDPEIVAALCGTALALGAGSPRVSVLALRVARAAAALEGRRELREEDAVLAGRLVLAPRATRLPAAQQRAPAPPQDPTATPDTPPPQAQSPPPQTPPAAEAPAPDSPQSAPADAPDAQTQTMEINQQDLDNLVLAATQAAIPGGLLDKLKAAAGNLGRGGAVGRVGALRNAGTRGRPAGVRSGAPQGHARLNVIETLRAAAPWQALRGRKDPGARVLVEPGDFRVTRYKQRSQTLTIFAVDASGSAALNRLAEAKGAVELLLADCYIRRDQVAVIAFRGRTAEVLLPPTRSLVRAKRSLAGLPGGGGTPLAMAIDLSVALATQAQRRGETPTLVMLTDGRANVARSGAAGREAAQAEALSAAKGVRLSRITALFVDTSTRPNAQARELAASMNAEYIALPYANARALSDIVKAATPAAR